MDEQTKQRLVAELRDYLDALPETPGDTGAAEQEPEAREVDLYTLFTELAGLKNEVQRESRQLKRALDEFRNVFATLEESSQRLGNELDARKEGQAEAVASAERALLLELVDLRDRLAQARDLASGYQPGTLQRMFTKRQGTLSQDMAEGLGITLRRLDQSLEQYGVKPIQAVGQPIDPHRMRVDSVCTDAAQPDGVALEETRRGYQRNDKVLRLAEVVANKREQAI
jgi:molecular chaperone GrpE